MHRLFESKTQLVQTTLWIQACYELAFLLVSLIGISSCFCLVNSYWAVLDAGCKYNKVQPWVQADAIRLTKAWGSRLHACLARWLLFLCGMGYELPLISSLIAVRDASAFRALSVPWSLQHCLHLSFLLSRQWPNTLMGLRDIVEIDGKDGNCYG